MNCVIDNQFVYSYYTNTCDMSDDMKLFMRIASARIKSQYGFAPQRQAIAAKMYINWLERKQDGSKRPS